MDKLFSPGKIYHLLLPEKREILLNGGRYEPDSLEKSGFIHFSTADQLLETANIHFPKPIARLEALAMDPESLGEQLKWEPSRKGELFPHLYGKIDPERIQHILTLKRNEKGYFEIQVSKK